MVGLDMVGWFGYGGEGRSGGSECGRAGWGIFFCAHTVNVERRDKPDSTIKPTPPGFMSLNSLVVNWK